MSTMVFCRGCAAQIHESAVACPQCGAQQGGQAAVVAGGKYATYAQVPAYRRNWFAILLALLFTPALLVILLTGDVYYERGGQLRTYGTGAKVFLIIWCVFTLGLMFAKA